MPMERGPRHEGSSHQELRISKTMLTELFLKAITPCLSSLSKRWSQNSCTSWWLRSLLLDTISELCSRAVHQRLSFGESSSHVTLSQLSLVLCICRSQLTYFIFGLPSNLQRREPSESMLAGNYRTKDCKTRLTVSRTSWRSLAHFLGSGCYMQGAPPSPRNAWG